MTKEEILEEASRLVAKDRNLSHGDAFSNHAEIAEYWNIFLELVFYFLFFYSLCPLAKLACDACGFYVFFI